MSEYVDEISDPKHREEQDQYLKEMVERGEMPPGSQLIQPETGFCIKTSGKRMVSDTKKTFFDQKTFINICWHESVDKPQ
jgi:dynein assembly factor 2